MFSKRNSERAAECGKMPAWQDDWFPRNQQQLENVHEQFSFLGLITFCYSLNVRCPHRLMHWDVKLVRGRLRIANLHCQFGLGNWSGASLGISAKAFSEEIN